MKMDLWFLLKHITSKEGIVVKILVKIVHIVRKKNNYVFFFPKKCAILHSDLGIYLFLIEINTTMAKVCQITGKKTQVGNNVSHANNKTKRKFFPNLKTKRFYLESEGIWVSLKVSTSALRTINKKGLEATLVDAARKGTLSL